MAARKLRYGGDCDQFLSNLELTRRELEQKYKVVIDALLWSPQEGALIANDLYRFHYSGERPGLNFYFKFNNASTTLMGVERDSPEAWNDFV